MLQAAEDFVVFGEPDIFSLVGILYYEGRIPQHLLDPLIKASFNVFCKNQKSHQTYVFKLQSNATRLVPDIIRLLPQVKHMFLWRRNASACVNSLVRSFDILNLGKHYMPLWKMFPQFSYWRNCLGFARMLSYLHDQLHPRDNIEIAYIFYLSPYSTYNKVKDLIEIVYIEYENLLAQPVEELSRIFDKFGIDLKLIPDAVGCLKRDSQSNTAVSWEKIGNIEVNDPIMSEERKKRYEAFDKFFGLDGLSFKTMV